MLKEKMDAKLKAIIERLNRRLREARKFQDTLGKRMKDIDADLAQLKVQRSASWKRR